MTSLQEIRERLANRTPLCVRCHAFERAHGGPMSKQFCSGFEPDPIFADAALLLTEIERLRGALIRISEQCLNPAPCRCSDHQSVLLALAALDGEGGE